jgi:hypothetical protein
MPGEKKAAATRKSSVSSRSARKSAPENRPSALAAVVFGRKQSSLEGKEGENAMNDNLTIDQARTLDTPNVIRVKWVYDLGRERNIRLYLDDFDGNGSSVQYADPDGALYEAFKRIGVEAS